MGGISVGIRSLHRSGVYTVVLAVAITLAARNQSPGVYMFLWVVIPSSTGPWAAREFYGFPPILSVEAVQAFSLLIGTLAAAAVLFRLPQHRARALFSMEEQNS